MISFVLLIVLAFGAHTSARSPAYRSSSNKVDPLFIDDTGAFSQRVDDSRVPPQSIREDVQVPILKQAIDGPNPDGSYSYSFETANGIKAEEHGELKPDGENGIASVRGSYSYQGDDGVDIVLTYVADENGFRPEGAHLPVAPPIPEAILKALEWIAAHPEEDNL